MDFMNSKGWPEVLPRDVIVYGVDRGGQTIVYGINPSPMNDVYLYGVQKSCKNTSNTDKSST